MLGSRWVPAAAVVVGLAQAAAAGDVLDAARRGDVAAVRALIRGGADVNARQPSGATALHWAVRRDSIDIASALLRAGAKPNVTNEYGVTPLMLACVNGSVPMIRALLDAGGDPDGALPSGETPLMTAARTGSLEGVEQLLARGAKVNAREHDSRQTALMWAVSEGHRSVAHLLVGRGADVSARTATGFTPLMFAARVGDLETARLLVASGAGVNDMSDDGTSVLHVATVRGHAPVAEWLIEVGADVNASQNGYTPLHWAVGRWESAMTKDYPVHVTEWNEIAALSGVPVGKTELIKSLLAHGADPNARTTKPPPRFGIAIHLSFDTSVVGATPFIIAALSGDADVMRLLLAAGADPMVKTRDGTTALMAAAGAVRAKGESLISESETLDATRLAVQIGIDLDAANEREGNTALHAAAYFGLPQVAQYLGEAGANLNVKNKGGYTPLKVADGVQRGGQFWASPPTADALRKLGARME